MRIKTMVRTVFGRAIGMWLLPTCMVMVALAVACSGIAGTSDVDDHFTLCPHEPGVATDCNDGPPQMTLRWSDSRAIVVDAVNKNGPARTATLSVKGICHSQPWLTVSVPSTIAVPGQVSGEITAPPQPQGVDPHSQVPNPCTVEFHAIGAENGPNDSAGQTIKVAITW